MKASVILRTAVIALTLAGMAAITPVSLQAATIEPAASTAEIWYVAPSGNDTYACTVSATPCATINAALNKPAFAAGDTVRVAAGTYTGSDSVVVTISKSATLSGGWNTAFTAQIGTSTVDGQNQTSGLLVKSYHGSRPHHSVEQ